MWRSIMSSRFASWVVGRVSLPKERQVQLELDLQRLYILTQLHKASSHGRTANMQQLILESQALEASSVRAEVEAALRRQVVATAEAIHEELVKAGDPAHAAARVTAAHEDAQRRREREASGLRKLLRGLLPEQRRRPPPPAAGAAAASEAAAAEPGPPPTMQAAAAGGCASSSSSLPSCPPPFGVPAAEPVSAGACGGGGTGELSGAAVSAALRRRLGFSLDLRPSTVPHPEAGTGLFLAGEARAGSVVAIFPGVLYGRTQLAHMPNYPRVDTDNPYLSCRFDQSIVDSKPWGRGDPGPGDCAEPASRGGDKAAAADASPLSPGPSSSSSPSLPTLPDAAAVGTAGSSGSLRTEPESGGPASESTSGHGGVGGAVAGSGGSPRRWWRWAGPLSTSLALLEGRHPLALAHFANHPGRGQSPNVLEASLDIHLDHPDLRLDARPWLRAYLPALQPPLDYDPFRATDDDEDDDDEDEDDDGGGGADKDSSGATRGGGRGQQQQRRQRPRLGPGELAPEQVVGPPGGVVRLLALVATRGLRDGEELLQNYRMNPHVVRPDWYVVHDAEAEQRRWAKIRALDLGFKGSKPVAAPPASGGGGGPAGGGGGDGGGAGG